MIYIIFLAALFVADRLTKWWAMHALITRPVQVNQFLSFELAFNRGISWGMFHGDNGIMFWLVTGATAFLIAALIGFCYVQMVNQQSIKAELLVITGAVSNLIDRFFYPGVIDFIHFSYQGWSWPVFNVADICIVVGVLWMGVKWMRA